MFTQTINVYKLMLSLNWCHGEHGVQDTISPCPPTHPLHLRCHYRWNLTVVTNYNGSNYSLSLFLKVFEYLFRVFLLLALEQTRSEDDGQIIGTHFVDVLMLCKSVKEFNHEKYSENHYSIRVDQDEYIPC